MLLSTLEASLNRNIAASSAAQALCSKLQGKSLRLQLSGLPTPITLSADAGSIKLQASDAGEAQATLSGSPLGLLSLAVKSTAANVSGSSVQIAGDAEVAQGFSDLLKQARPDIEEELSRMVGDVTAHQLGVTARHLFSFGQRVARSFTQNVGEYLQEESRDVPHRFEVDEFVHGVDTLRDDVERFAARLALLEKKNK